MEQFKGTLGPWRVAMSLSGASMEAPKGLDKSQRKKWDALMAERNSPMRENSGAFIIMSGEPGSEDQRRIGTADLQVRAKRGQGYNTEDQEALANAHLFAAATELMEAVQGILHANELEHEVRESRMEVAFDEARAAIAKALGK